MCVADQWLGVCRRKWELQQRDCTGLAPVSLFIALPRGVANRCVGKGKANAMACQVNVLFFFFSSDLNFSGVLLNLQAVFVKYISRLGILFACASE